MSLGDCFVPVVHGTGQLLGPKEELDSPYDVKRANRLCGVSFIDSKRSLARKEPNSTCSLRGRCKKGRRRGRKRARKRGKGKGAPIPSPFPFFPIPNPFRRLLRRLVYVRERALLESEARKCTTQSMKLLLSRPSFLNLCLHSSVRFSESHLKKQALPIVCSLTL